MVRNETLALKHSLYLKEELKVVRRVLQGLNLKLATEIVLVEEVLSSLLEEAPQHLEAL